MNLKFCKYSDATARNMQYDFSGRCYEPETVFLKSLSEWNNNFK